MSRDPIEEKGGLNLYDFVNNGAINMIDVLGLDFWSWTQYVPFAGTIYGMAHTYPGESIGDYNGNIDCSDCDPSGVGNAAAEYACAKRILAQLSKYLTDMTGSNLPKLGVDVVAGGVSLAIPGGQVLAGALAIDAIAGASVTYHNAGNMQKAAQAAIDRQCHCDGQKNPS